MNQTRYNTHRYDVYLNDTCCLLDLQNAYLPWVSQSINLDDFVVHSKTDTQYSLVDRIS
jgi:hypothetical protein